MRDRATHIAQPTTHITDHSFLLLSRFINSMSAQANSSEIPLSVVICTFNRAELLRKALECVCGQRDCDDDWEILVVDNRSTDETKAVVDEVCRKDPKVRYLYEERQGLSHARNQGWREAQGCYVGYIDDDCFVPPRWVAEAQMIIVTQRPDVFGGGYVPAYVSRKPAWAKDVYFSNMPWDNPRFLKTNQYISGGNLFFRRTILKELDGFDPDLGICGKRRGMGEETQLIDRLRTRPGGASVFYSPALTVRHVVNPARMTTWWILKHHFTDGSYHLRISPDRLREQRSRWDAAGGVLRNLWRFVREWVWGIRHRDREQYPYMMNFLYEHLSGRVQEMGRCWYLIRHRRSKSA